LRELLKRLPMGLLVLFCAASLYAATPPAVGGTAPDFALPASSGSNVRLSEYRGQVVVLSFWSSRCSVCAAQLADLRQLQRTYGSAGLVTLAVSIDDDMAHARDYAAAHGGDLTMLLDQARAVGRSYDVGHVPTILLIDRSGRLRYRRDDIRRIDNPYISQLRALLDDAPVKDRTEP